jgi:hypothetical protein
MLDFSLPLKAAGIGMIFPGAGVLYRGNVWLFLIVLALAAIAIVRMCVVADHLSLLLLYLGSVVVAASLPGDTAWTWVVWVAACVVAASITLIEALQWMAYLRARRIGRECNAYLQNQSARTDFGCLSSGDPQVVESTLDELRLQRWVLDHALQPLDDWDVYDWSEKAQRDPRGVRYQLNWLPADGSSNSTVCSPVRDTARPAPSRPASPPMSRDVAP